MKDVVEAGYIT